MKDELDVKIMTKFAVLKSKKYSSLKEDGDEKKNSKGTKKCAIK